VALPTVTALREKSNGRVAVQLDGENWRILPADVVVRAGLRCGAPLDREHARTLARELRRARALEAAARALRHRDLPRQRLAERLTNRGVGPAARDEALDTLSRSGVLDDARFAESRASALAERNLGNAAIRHDLASHGLSPDLVEQACAQLPSEHERVARVVARRGRSAATARYLTRRGFDADVVEQALPVEFAPDAQGELG